MALRYRFMTCAALAACAVAMNFAASSPAGAQGGLAVKDINFDLWCQEQQHLPPDRCDKRLPEDEKAFEAYVDKIQGYEVQYLKSREQQQEIDRNILHNDPVDNPTQPSAPQSPVPPNTPPH